MKAMQKLRSTFSFLTLALLFSFHAKADDGVTKEKSYSKTYPLSSGDKVDIGNSFGKVEVHTWDQSQIKVDVHITATASTEAEANDILNRISIHDGKEGADVHFQTDIANDDDHGNHGNRKMSIDYTVYLPSAQALALRNSFGKIILPDYAGTLEVTSKFGSLEAGRLGAVKLLHVQFGKAAVQSVHALNESSIEVKYSPAEFNEVSGNVDAKFEFCEHVNLHGSSALKGLTISDHYSHLNLDLPKGLPLNFDISTHFGSFNNESAYPLKGDDDEDSGPHFSHKYTGQSGDGSINIRIHADFGNIDIS